MSNISAITPTVWLYHGLKGTNMVVGLGESEARHLSLEEIGTSVRRPVVAKFRNSLGISPIKV